MAELDIILKQQPGRGHETLVKLIEGRQLQVLQQQKNKRHSYSVDILSLQDKSKKEVYIAWGWLLSGIVFFGTMLLLLKYLPAYLGQDKNLILSGVLLLGVMGSLISLVMFFKKTSRKQVFYSRKANVPLVSLCIGKPDKKSFGRFIDAIETRILKFRKHMDIDDEKQLTGEMKMLRRLADEGIISSKQYETAKTKLLKGFG